MGCAQGKESRQERDQRRERERHERIIEQKLRAQRASENLKRYSQQQQRQPVHQSQRYVNGDSPIYVNQRGKPLDAREQLPPAALELRGRESGRRRRCASAVYECERK